MIAKLMPFLLNTFSVFQYHFFSIGQLYKLLPMFQAFTKEDIEYGQEVTHLTFVETDLPLEANNSLWRNQKSEITLLIGNRGFSLFVGPMGVEL